MDNDPQRKGAVNGECTEGQIHLEQVPEAPAQQGECGTEKESGAKAKILFGRWSLKKTGLVVVVVVVSIAVVCGIVLPLALDRNGTRYITESELRDVVNVENLNTIDYTYKGIAESHSSFLWMDAVDYRVKYTAHVRASYDMSAIEFSIDKENGIVTAYIPPATISDPILDNNQFGYLPEKTNAELPTVIALCKEDAAKEVNREQIQAESLKSLEDTIRALTLPLLGDDLSLQFKSLSEYSGTGEQNES